MLITNAQYQYVLQVPDNWADFNAKQEEFLDNLSWKFDKKTAEQILKIIDYNWSDFEGQTAILIIVEGYTCLTWITDEFEPIECSEKVFAFDKNQIYPQQRAEMKICFKRYY